MVRAFIAVDMSQEAREALADVISELQGTGISGVRWASSGGIHLTLKFLGDIESTQVDPTLEGIGRAAEASEPFTLSISELGAFPGPNNPRVIWVGLKGDLEPLGNLQQRIDHEVQSALGLPLETRPFTPHLTVGRLWDRVSSEQRHSVGKAISDVAVRSEVRWQVTEVDLVRSTLAPSGAQYDILGSRQVGGIQG